MTWNETPHHHISFFNFFSYHGVMDCIFFMACCDKITCCNFILFLILSKKNFDVINQHVHVHILHLYKIH